MFTIRRMGCDGVHYGDFMINRPNGYDCRLILFIKTKARFIINGEEIQTQPKTFIMFEKSSPHYYGAVNDKYVNDWIQADCASERYCELCGKPIFIGDNINVEAYMHLIGDAFFRGIPKASSMLLDAMLTEIAEISESPAVKSPHYRELIELRKEIYSEPGKKRSVKSMAEQLHISEAYLQELYKNTFRISVGADIIAARIDAAKSMLLDGDLSAAEIGYQCGYSCPEHFTKQFSKITGLPPIKWRMKNNNRSNIE